ncbi:MAG TPA: hemerythrin domain-containing protein [Casimicrobiaceae bacterium]
MTTISDFMTSGHRACDELFARAEEAAGDWAKTTIELDAFRRALELHLVMEEDVLFPAFEERTGMTGGGPTEAMRVEHAQMRALTDQLADAAADCDEKRYLGIADTLHVLIQQHNMKEEGMMYPMLDSAVADRIAELIASCNAVESGGACTLHGRQRA